MWGYHWGWWGGMHLLSGMVFWALILVGLVLFMRRARWNAPNGSDTALEVLKKRYARGEIGAEEYASKKRDLTE